MVTLGITGGVATGKTTVTRILASLGVKVIDSDALVHELVQPKRKAWRNIVKAFGSEVLRKDNTIDREMLGQIVFNNSSRRKYLENVIHPEIKRIIQKQLVYYEKAGEKIVGVEIPLLFEANMGDIVDKIVVVKREGSLQLKILQEERRLSKEDALKRIRAQLPIEEKIAGADFVIDNNGSLAETEEQVREIINKIYKEG